LWQKKTLKESKARKIENIRKDKATKYQNRQFKMATNAAEKRNEEKGCRIK